MEATGVLEKLLDAGSRGVDLTKPADLRGLTSMAEALESRFDTADQAAAMDQRVSTDGRVSIFARVALKLAVSRLRLRELERPVHVSVVFAVYRERRRLLTQDEHRLGEDALREKMRQLRWLFERTPEHSWDLLVVDDGCPESSGKVAQAILAQQARPDEQGRVLWLQEAVERGLPITRDLASAEDSQKGGAIRLGLWSAVQQTRAADHVVLFTDADLSTHLGQVGLLVHPIASAGVVAAVGSRRKASSVVVKSGGRDHRGKVFIYLWKRMLPELRGLIDTQCGFKAFSAADLRTWIEGTRDNGFSFDIEALLTIRRRDVGQIARVPVAWIDSEEASTTAEHAPYLPMLRSVVRMRAAAGADRNGGEPFARLVERLDEEAFERLLAHAPPAITRREPSGFDEFAGVTADELASLAGV
jgi:hypothetical protein